jgi:transposase
MLWIEPGKSAVFLALSTNRTIILAATYHEICDRQHISWFCDLYREWVGRLKPTLRQVHTAGQRVFVDFAGHTMEVIDGATGEIHHAEVFVGLLGASSYVFAQTIWTQSLIPARPYKPRDKAKVEVGVQVVQRWILARLRNRRFFSLAGLNQAIRELVDQLNDRPMRGWGTTRRALYEQLDRPALRALPPTPSEYATWKRCRVNLDHHVEIDKHFYSVAFRLRREEVEARITVKTVEIFHRGKLVATHLRSLRPHRPTTLAEHMPSSHRRYRDWTHERILREAATIGDDTTALVEIILRSRPHPEQGFRSSAFRHVHVP